jgi:hypothetical protein
MLAKAKEAHLADVSSSKKAQEGPMVELRKNPINRRALTSVAMLFSFSWLPPSGIALHFTGSGSFQPVRHTLMAVHNMSALLFLIAAAFHLGLNRKAMAQYLVSKAAEYRTVRKETVIAALVVTTIIVLFASHAFHVPR